MPAVAVYKKLSASTQEQVIQKSGLSEEYLRDYPPSNEHLALLVCSGSMLQALDEMLDLGLNPSWVSDEQDQNKSPGIAPLAELNYRDPESLSLVDLLLSKGANPNVIAGLHRDGNLSSPMHAASLAVNALRKLIAAGGSVLNVDGQGWTVVDEWLYMSREFVHSSVDILPPLQEIVKAGWNPESRLYQGRALLSACWGYTQLRECLPEMFSMGFDPRQEDVYKDSPAPSLLSLALDSLNRGKRTHLAEQVLAHAQALDLISQLPSPTCSTPGKMRF